MKQTIVLIVALVVGVSACGGGATPITPSSDDVSGIWIGPNALRGEFALSLVQASGGSLSGTWVINNGQAQGGTLTGFKTAAALTITLYGNANTCVFDFAGTVLTTRSLTGTLTGETCQTNAPTAMTFTKQ